jgi:hypothetical protein
MGLLNKRTLNKAKDLAMKNKEKIATGVSKATDTIDKKTGGKHADKLKKLDDAASKFAGHPADDGTVTEESPHEPTPSSETSAGPADEPSEQR